eukprot:gnl/TRDRNA2_/TRDRNA2_156159_c0_seq3.p1 gnl/TRDRNA2_/TRDRNA2_156159_c0~~gnl/TRDRNA2_/TRDRNA2_156159_c0_seq3.p1  ORF type:complete len:227 (-),score=50.65 gnl/TRDRNA2_/TRDRNA2_156159_c0_seq3:232-912(-)
MTLMTVAFAQVYFILQTPIAESPRDSEDQKGELYIMDFLTNLYVGSWIGEIHDGFGEGPVIDRMMFVLMTVFMLVVLLNLLIAIMGDTFMRVQECTIVEFYHNFAALIHELEVLMTAAEHRSGKFFPRYMIFSEKLVASGKSSEDDEEPGKAGPPKHGTQAEQAAQAAPQGPGSDLILPQILAELKSLQRGQQRLQGQQQDQWKLLSALGSEVGITTDDPDGGASV